MKSASVGTSFFSLGVGLAVALGGMTGCDKLQEKLAQRAADKVVENASGGEVNVDSTKGGAVTVTDKKTGTVVQGGSAVKLPDGWPAAVPIYPGSTVRSAVSSAGGKNVTLATPDSAAKVTAFYKSRPNLPVESEMNLGTQQIIALKHGSKTVAITIGQAGTDTMVGITVSD